MKEEILEKLKEYHQKIGVAFFSVEDSYAYFKGLVELIESLITNKKV